MERARYGQAVPRSAIFLDRRTSLREWMEGAKLTRRMMTRPPPRTGKLEARPRRQRFADGSAVVTYRGGSVLILECALAKPVVLRERGPVIYSNPPAGVGKTAKR